ncbi:MAG: amidase [Geminicoccaceae bacterium]
MRVRDVVEASLERIGADELNCWKFLDPEHARAQADALDASGNRDAPLFGVPVGVKDIVDTADMPTENGSPLCAGRRPQRDAWVVSRLREAGAVILGKTVTTEFACFAPLGGTRNPHDPERTPGGSSSGSAAAVAAGMVPLAIGSQTNGSVIRPASFCGVHGFKPTMGLIPRTGFLTTAHSLDHPGMFADSLEGIALLMEVLAGYDPDDPTTSPKARRAFRKFVAEGPAAPPRLAFVRGPTWDMAEPATVTAFERLAAKLSAREVALPAEFDDAVAVHRTLWTTELAFHLRRFLPEGRAQMSPELLALIDAGQATDAQTYLRALATRKDLIASLDRLFADYDAILTPAAPGEAPKGIGATGSPAFCTLWSLTGVPAISLPLLTAPSGMPMGVQLVGAPGDDARLLANARWVREALSLG